MPRDFGDFTTGLDNPASQSFVITPNDATDLPFITRGLYVGATGDVAVLLAFDEVAVTFPAMVGGSLYPLRVKKVLAAGTTATGLRGVL